MRLLRAFVVASVVLVFADAAVLLAWGPTAPGPVVSGAIQFVMCLLSMAVAIVAGRSRDASAYERRFLFLVAVRYGMCALGQLLATNDLIGTRVPFSGSLADLLFHLEDVPLGIAFFLDPGRDADRLERPKVLDVAQVVLFWITVAMYVKYLCDAPASVGLVAATDALVAGCFCIRALTSRSTVASSLFGRWTLAILLSTVNDAYSGFYNSDPGQPFDLVWVLESLVWIVTAASWTPLRAAGPVLARRSVRRTLALLPLVVACFALVLALGIAQRRPTLAVVLGVATLLCAGLRLWRQRAQVVE